MWPAAIAPPGKSTVDKGVNNPVEEVLEYI
jgi:hypothetical protein